MYLYRIILCCLLVAIQAPGVLAQEQLSTHPTTDVSNKSETVLKSQPSTDEPTPKSKAEVTTTSGTDKAATDNTKHLSSTTRASLKTVTFQTAANLMDTVIFGFLMGADATTSVAFLAANTASAMVAYFPYEIAWDYFGPPPEATTTKTIATKTAGYQVVTGLRNLALSYAFSGTIWSSMAFVVAVIVVDAGIYIANEYIWDWISPRAPSTALPKPAKS